jgi:NitT/TauT family transport system substrate-binding protein
MRSALAVVLLVLATPARAAVPVRVILPDPDNLQLMAFWVARGAGLFEREGLAVTLSVPPSPGGVLQRFLQGDAPAAVLPAPAYLDLIAQRAPIRLVANLLRHEPANLVVRSSALGARGISLARPLAERLRALRGLKVGVAPGPVGRLRALFASAGLVADEVVQIVGVAGPEQNDALASGRVDALFAHTPYLEEALARGDGALVVHASAGDIPALSFRQIHALAVDRAWADRHDREVGALVRSLAAAELLVHRDQAAAVDAVLRALPAKKRDRVERIVALYQPAVPDRPSVTAEGIRSALALFPTSRPAPLVMRPRSACHSFVIGPSPFVPSGAKVKEDDDFRCSVHGPPVVRPPVLSNCSEWRWVRQVGPPASRKHHWSQRFVDSPFRFHLTPVESVNCVGPFCVTMTARWSGA